MEFSKENSENKGQESEFVAEINTLPKHVLEGAERGVEQFKKGAGITFEEFAKKHFLTSINTDESRG